MNTVEMDAPPPHPPSPYNHAPPLQCARSHSGAFHTIKEKKKKNNPKASFGRLLTPRGENLTQKP